VAEGEGGKHIPAIFVTFIFGPFVPDLPIPVDSSFIIPIKNIILPFDNPRKSQILEFEWNPILDPMINIIRK